MEITGIETFRFTNPYPEKVPAEGEYEVYNNIEGLSHHDLFHNVARPVFIFTREIWEEVQYITKASPNSEFALFLITKQFTYDINAPKYMAIDLFFPEQEAGAGGVSMDSAKYRDFTRLLNTHEAYKEHTDCKVAHLHSHNSMGVFWSAADNNQQLSNEDLGFYDTFRYYLVVNTHNQVRCSFVTYIPVLRRMDNIPVIVVGPKEFEISAERKAVLDSYLAERVKPLTTNVFEDIQYFDGYETEQPVPKPVYTPPLEVTKPKPVPQFAPVKQPTLFDYDYDYHYDKEFKLPDYEKAAEKVLNYAYTFEPDEELTDPQVLADELYRFDYNEALARHATHDEDLHALETAFGDMEHAVEVYEWLAINEDELFMYRDLLNLTEED